MEQRLREYVERLFAAAPQTQQMTELREEIICNTILRYHDLLEEGKSEQQAYQAAIDGVGDVSELFGAVGENTAAVGAQRVVTGEQAAQIASRSKLFKAIAVALYILCITPPTFLSATGLSDVGAAFMFFFISAATGLLVYGKATKYLPLEDNPEVAATTKTSAVMLAVAVGLYISCVTPPILLSRTALSSVSPVFMFLMVAAATFLVIFRKRTKTNARLKADAAHAVKKEEAAMEKHVPRKGLYRGLVAVIWVTISVLFIIITAITACDQVTWLLFPLAFALQRLLRAVLDLTEVGA